MSKIRIKNFGPIRDGFVDNDGWMDVKKVTVLIGNQGSGKSTVAKLISIFSWLEKDLFRTGGFSLKFHQQEGTFKHRLEYHRIEKYLNNNTEILYNGDAYNLTYKAGQNLDIQEISDNNYTVKISFNVRGVLLVDIEVGTNTYRRLENIRKSKTDIKVLILSFILFPLEFQVFSLMEHV